MKESEKNFDKTRTRSEKFNDSGHEFSKSKINKLRRNFYKIENKKNLSAPKIKEIEKNLLELEKNLSKSKKYYDYDNYEYKGIKSIRNLPIDKDYKPVIIDGAFNNNYVQYEIIGSENLSVKEYLDKIINIHSGNTIIEPKTQGEWKINNGN